MAVNGTRNSPIVTVKAPRPREDEIDNRPMVLVVDDEPAIADTVVKILNLSGYAAVAAYDADEAIETALIAPPSLLITDVVMPGKNGIELAITIKRIYPECKTLLFSGQASTADLMASANRAGYRFNLLNKPVPPQKLLEMVEENLGNSAVLSEAN